MYVVTFFIYLCVVFTRDYVFNSKTYMKLILTSLFITFFHMVASCQLSLDSLVTNPLYVPNAVTFDHDNINDGWRAESMVEWDDYEVLIYNKWGECIWMSADIEEWWIGDHRFKGTHYSRDGLYTYSISARKGLDYINKMGTIYVIR